MKRTAPIAALLTGFVLAIAAFVSAPPALAADPAADPAAGKQLSERWCSGCHVEPRSGGVVSDQALTFSELARARGCDTKRLQAWLTNPHPPMPNLSLTRTEIANVVAYLCELAWK